MHLMNAVTWMYLPLYAYAVAGSLGRASPPDEVIGASMVLLMVLFIIGLKVGPVYYWAQGRSCPTGAGCIILSNLTDL